MKPLLHAAFAIASGVLLGWMLGVMLPARPGPRAHVSDITELQSMVREAATFGWRCHEHGDNEETCTLAVMQVIGGGK